MCDTIQSNIFFHQLFSEFLFQRMNGSLSIFHTKAMEHRLISVVAHPAAQMKLIDIKMPKSLIEGITVSVKCGSFPLPIRLEKNSFPW